MIQIKITKALFFFLLIAFVSANSGTYTVTGLDKRKQAILNAGGGSWDIAIAMHQTKNLGTGYIYGDAKSDGSANFGIFKQNWFMLRTSNTQFNSYTFSSSYNNGNVLTVTSVKISRPDKNLKKFTDLINGLLVIVWAKQV